MMKTSSYNSILGTYSAVGAGTEISAQIRPQALSGIQRNSRIEKAVIEHIADHPAVKVVMGALMEALTDVFIKAHGEVKGWAEIVKAACRPHDSNRHGSGVLSPRFDEIGSVGWNAAAIRATSRAGTLREKGTLFFSLMLSDNFKHLLGRVVSDPDLQRKLEGGVDLGYLKACEGNLLVTSGWAAQAGEIREKIGQARYETASNLNKTLISARELAFHRHNPVNHPSAQPNVGFDKDLPEESDLQILRGYGSSVWGVKPDSDFARRAEESAKPVIAGPSGTASRLVSVARFLAPACLKRLDIESEQGFKELVRYACYAYLGQDSHHSMLEVNLGVAPHGMPEQWDDTLYTEPFSHSIKGNGFGVDNDAQMRIFSQTAQIP
ncbi:Type III effector HopT1-1 [Pseudomonas syringae pv. philadelphi]|uniref:Type III effector HopT1-1 n=1 Tax=Pseudomonas syringae pv. philadelphi TaxID=251706 RepID=A0A3M3Z1Y7_9PSED|nr:type III effector [Pseudomonas syringae group genomosp. 3]RMO88790.1 Type III effector HopT1-1 [Pseudomonas syringae pv. philadelphi]